MCSVLQHRVESYEFTNVSHNLTASMMRASSVTLTMEAVLTSETLVNSYCCTRCCRPEGGHLRKIKCPVSFTVCYVHLSTVDVDDDDNN
jgi:hypothetical protein